MKLCTDEGVEVSKDDVSLFMNKFNGTGSSLIMVLDKLELFLDELSSKGYVHYTTDWDVSEDDKNVYVSVQVHFTNDDYLDVSLYSGDDYEGIAMSVEHIVIDKFWSAMYDLCDESERSDFWEYLRD